MGGHASWLTLGDPLFVVRTLNQTIHETFDLNYLVLSHNASDELSQLLTESVKTRTFVWVQSKVSKQTKHVHLRTNHFYTNVKAKVFNNILTTS